MVGRRIAGSLFVAVVAGMVGAQEPAVPVEEGAPDSTAAVVQLPPGNPADNLKALSETYGTKVTDEATRADVEAQRNALLSAIAADRAFVLGPETRDVVAIQAAHERLLSVYDELKMGISIKDDLSSFRYLNFVIVTSYAGDADDGAFVSGGAEKNFGKLLEQSDPWIASTVLFLARKGQARITPAQVAKRWAAGPLKWDAECTKQALLYFAQQGQPAMAGLKPVTADMQKELKRLQPLPWSTCQAQMMFFARQGRVTDKLDIVVPRAGNIMVATAATRKWVDGKSNASGVVGIRSGTWVLKSIDGDASGESKPIEFKQGVVHRFMIPFVRGTI